MPQRFEDVAMRLTDHDPHQLLTLDEVATICRVKSVKTVRGWIKDGIDGVKLPASRLGRFWRVQPDDLMRFLKSRRR